MSRWRHEIFLFHESIKVPVNFLWIVVISLQLTLKHSYGSLSKFSVIFWTCALHNFLLEKRKKENVFNNLQITQLIGFILKWFRMHLCWCYFSVNIFDKFTDTWTTEISAWTMVCFPHWYKTIFSENEYSSESLGCHFLVFRWKRERTSHFHHNPSQKYSKSMEILSSTVYSEIALFCFPKIP